VRTVPGTSQLPGFFGPKTLAHTQEAVVARRARNRALADFVASQGATFVPAALGAPSGGTVRLPGGKSESLNQFFAGAGAGALAGSIGFASELGALTINPALAIPGAVLLIGELTGLIPSLAGKPKLLDTAQAAQRLLSSPFVPLQLLGQRLAISVKNGVPLSTGNPRLQAQIRQAIQGTVQTILSQYPLAGSAGSVDTLLNRALTSQFGPSATAQLNQVLTRSALLTAPARQPSARPNLPALPTFTPFQPGPLSVARLQPAMYGETPGLPAPQPNLPPNTPAPLSRLVNMLHQIEPTTAEQIAGCVALALAGQEELAAPCLEHVAVRVVGQGAANLVASIRKFISNQFGHGTPLRSRGQQTTNGTRPAPILDQQKPCPECERGLSAEQRAQLARERAELQKEIQTEQGQQATKTLDQVQQQLDTLKNLESQPLEQRDIQSELQQKNQLQSELDALSGQGSQPGQSPSPVPGQPAPMLQQNQAAQQVEQEIEQQQSSEAVQFCVGCQSGEDAILFLNGEQSKCSVVPGSTKSIQVPS